jgi:hypothetical protein
MRNDSMGRLGRGQASPVHFVWQERGGRGRGGEANGARASLARTFILPMPVAKRVWARLALAQNGLLMIPQFVIGPVLNPIEEVYIQ